MDASAEKLRPLGDGVLVRVAKAEDTSKGGIIIPDAAKEKPRRGEVLAVGLGAPVSQGGEATIVIARDGSRSDRRPVEVKPGEVVLFGAYVGTEVGPDLLLLKEADLIAAVERAPESGS
jgi:chaperonin GroES